MDPRPLSHPAGQLLHAVAPVCAPLYVPAAHSAHALWPASPWNFATGHSMHSRCPASMRYMPAGQSVHVACASLVWPRMPTLPGGHGVPEHDVSLLQPPALYWPDGHTAHVLQ